MRSRPADDRVTELTRRRLAALTAELAAARGEDVVVPGPPSPSLVPDGLLDGVAAEEAAPDNLFPGGALPRPVLPGRHAHRHASWQNRLTGWAGDRLPPALANRPHLGSAQAGLVLVIVAAGLVLSAWWLLRAGASGAGAEAPPRPSVAAPAPVSSASTGPSSGIATGSPVAVGGTTSTQASPAAGDGRIVVDVAGKVRRPGIAVLPAGSRVVDAVRAAGGLRPGFDRSTVNLARPLTDGEQVLIGIGPAGVSPPGAPGPSASSSAAAPGALVNINTADETALETLPGVGPVTAQAILQWRTEHGGFTSVDELLEVSGIGDATLAKIAPYCTL